MIGCFFGQVIGDALGSYLEFQYATEVNVNMALEMNE